MHLLTRALASLLIPTSLGRYVQNRARELAIALFGKDARSGGPMPYLAGAPPPMSSATSRPHLDRASHSTCAPRTDTAWMQARRAIGPLPEAGSQVHHQHLRRRCADRARECAPRRLSRVHIHRLPSAPTKVQTRAGHAARVCPRRSFSVQRVVDGTGPRVRIAPRRAPDCRAPRSRAPYIYILLPAQVHRGAQASGAHEALHAVFDRAADLRERGLLPRHTGESPPSPPPSPIRPNPS